MPPKAPKAGAQFGILDQTPGPFDFGKPKPKVDKEAEKRRALIATSKEWKVLKKLMEDRIAYWQHWLPGNVELDYIMHMDDPKVKAALIASHNIIREFEALIQVVEETYAIVAEAAG